MKLPKLSKYDRVEIQWVDIISDSRWHSDSDIHKVKPAPCLFVGLFVDKDKDCLRCCSTVAMADDEKDFSVFPLGVIRSITILKRNKNGS